MVKRIARRAVSPVLATLMMVAVAVALSVIIFTWSQGFLSQTGEAASGQQAQQNIAAQSGILIESATIPSDSNQATLYVRNVGTVTVTIDSYSYTLRRGETTYSYSGSLDSEVSIPPRSSSSVTVSLASAHGSFASGDVFTVKLITTAGTFAQATFMVP
jgi:flagellin-like protein